MKIPAGTFLLTLPDETKVLCWRKDAAKIKADVMKTGEVVLIRNPETGVYDRSDRIDAAAPEVSPFVRRVG